MNSKELSILTGISDRTIRDWQSKGIVPKSDFDNLPLSAYISAIVSYLKEQAEQSKTKDEDDDLYLEKIRLTKATADKVELEIAVRKGELIESVDACAEWSRLVAAFRARMLSLPPKAAPQIIEMENAVKAEALLKDFVYEALLELSGYRSAQTAH